MSLNFSQNAGPLQYWSVVRPIVWQLLQRMLKQAKFWEKNSRENMLREQSWYTDGTGTGPTVVALMLLFSVSLFEMDDSHP